MFGVSDMQINRRILRFVGARPSVLVYSGLYRLFSFTNISFVAATFATFESINQVGALVLGCFVLDMN